MNDGIDVLAFLEGSRHWIGIYVDSWVKNTSKLCVQDVNIYEYKWVILYFRFLNYNKVNY